MIGELFVISACEKVTFLMFFNIMIVGANKNISRDNLFFNE